MTTKTAQQFESMMTTLRYAGVSPDRLDAMRETFETAAGAEMPLPEWSPFSHSMPHTVHDQYGSWVWTCPFNGHVLELGFIHAGVIRSHGTRFEVCLESATKHWQEHHA